MYRNRQKRYLNERHEAWWLQLMSLRAEHMMNELATMGVPAADMRAKLVDDDKDGFHFAFLVKVERRASGKTVHSLSSIASAHRLAMKKQGPKKRGSRSSMSTTSTKGTKEMPSFEACLKKVGMLPGGGTSGSRKSQVRPACSRARDCRYHQEELLTRIGAASVQMPPPSTNSLAPNEVLRMVAA